VVSRVFLSHSSRDSRQAVAVKKWLIEQEPGLAEEIYLDVDPQQWRITLFEPASPRWAFKMRPPTGRRGPGP
jgi:hypothetical protein